FQGQVVAIRDQQVRTGRQRNAALRRAVEKRGGIGRLDDTAAAGLQLTTENRGVLQVHVRAVGGQDAAAAAVVDGRTRDEQAGRAGCLDQALVDDGVAGRDHQLIVGRGGVDRAG